MSIINMTDCFSSPFLKSIGLQHTELITSPTAYSKLDSFDQKQELEKEFCRDFSCCGLNLGNLHQLLEHYEEYHLSRGDSASSEEDGHDRDSSLKTGHREEDFVLLQQPMHLAQLAAITTKEHLTNSDLTMLENAQRYTFKSSVQTLDSIVDGLTTPSLSPSESSFRDDHYFEDKVPENKNFWIRRANMIMSSSNSHTCEDQSDKPYRCHIEDCDKAYKNANGLKYHRLHGHCPPSIGDDGFDASKPYTCSFGSCRKRYKNLNGLKYHIDHTHMTKLENLSSDMFVKAEPEQEPSKGSRKRKMSVSDSDLSSVLSSPESLLSTTSYTFNI